VNGTRIPALEVRGVEKFYAAGRPDAVAALRGVTLSIAPGEFVSVEGPSGCGKTTLLNLIGLIDVPSKGDILWDGVAISSKTERDRSRLRLTGIGFIFQRFYLLPTLTARENVELPIRALGRPAAERAARSRELLDEVGLSARQDAYPHELSGGEEQRVAIARSLANRPGLLLADEPTGELDRANTEGVLAILKEIHRSTGATILLVTHNPRVAAQAERHLEMQDGRIVADTRAAR
jgi:putative ABC transport system ATP-binding protein